MKNFNFPKERKAIDIEKTLKKRNGRGDKGREKGEANLKIVRKWFEDHPYSSKAECQRGTGLSYYVVARCFGIIFK